MSPGGIVSNRFRILGEIEVSADGSLLTIGHSRQRHVLAALLVDANQRVAVGELTDRVYGERHPPSARESIYSYVSRLRSALASARDVALDNQSGGYVLRLDPASVDLYQFQSLVARARDADDEDAVTLASEALSLWRGEALAGMDTSWFNAVRTALHRERTEAELSRNDLALRLGRHKAILAELHRQAAAHPLDERYAGQLMLALHHDGRTAEALSQYQRARMSLLSELGTEPGPALRQLQQGILAAERALERPAAAAPPVPRQLPPAPRAFTGRARDLAKLTAALGRGTSRDATPVAVIQGLAGVGKTSLAVHWACQHSELFPDGQLFLDLRGYHHASPPLRPATALRTLLGGLGMTGTTLPTETQALTGLFRSVAAGKRMLLILDDAVGTAQVLPLLPGDPSCTVIVTSRRDLGALGASVSATMLSLGLLDDAEARQMLTSRLGTTTTAGTALLGELVHACAGLPLALAIVGAKAAGHPGVRAAQLAKELRSASTRLDAIETGEPSGSLRTALARSCQTLPADVQRAFALIGLAPGPEIGLLAAASLTGLPAARTRRQLKQLERVHLLCQYAPGCYRMHELVWSYAAERAIQYLGNRGSRNGTRPPVSRQRRPRQ